MIVIIILLSALLFSACNPDVFIDDFLPETPELVFKDGKATVEFEADNWGIFGVGLPYSMPLTISDLDGNPLNKSLPLDESDLAVVSMKDGFRDFSFIKSDRRTLEVVLGENLSDNSFECVVLVGNKHEFKSISVAFPPSSKYQLDSVVFQMDEATVSDNLKEVDSLIVDNRASDQPVTLSFFPYKNSHRTVTCFWTGGFWDSSLFARVFGEKLPQIPVPDYVDGKLVVKEAKISIGDSVCESASGLDSDFEASTSVKAGSFYKVVVYNKMAEYSVGFTVHASNPETGKKRTINGEMISEQPYGYLILKHLVKDEKTDN